MSEQANSLATILQSVAKTCHEANRILCATKGDYSQQPWDECPDWQKESAVKGVVFAVDFFDMHGVLPPPEKSHESWYQEKVADGWQWGAEKDVEKKLHPCMVPYEQLGLDQQYKDYMFLTIVGGVLGMPFHPKMRGELPREQS